MSAAIAVANHKGGVGKTTTVVNLGAALAEAGKRVLVVDVDPQAHLTAGLGVHLSAGQSTLHHLLLDDGIDAETVVVNTDFQGLSLIPSCIDLSAAEPYLAAAQATLLLRSRLQYLLPAFDYALFDCPPSLGFLTLNALCAATGVLIPVDVGSWALRGISHLVAVVDVLRAEQNPQLSVLGVLLSMYDARTSLSEEVLSHLRDYFGDAVFRTVIRRTVRLVRAGIDEEPILAFEPRGDIAAAYRALANEVMARV